MQLWHGIVFVMILALVPEAADAFQGFTVNPGSCSNPNSFEIECSSNPAEGMFSAVACQTMKIFNAAAIPMYCNLVANPYFLNAITALLSLYVIFWAITYLFGLTTATAGNAAMRLLKFAFIFYFLTNQDLFFGIVYETVVSLPEAIVQLMLASKSGGVENYSFYTHVDKGINEMFDGLFYPEVHEQNGTTSKKLEFRLFVLGFAIWKLIPGGAFLAGLFFSVVSGWLGAYLSIMIRYLLALMTLIFLLMLGPIFITSFFFDKTKYLGEEWIKMISSFMLQIVIVVAFVIMVEDFFVQFYEIIKVGYNDIVIDKVVTSYDIDYGGLTKAEESFGITAESSKKYVEDLESLGLRRAGDVTGDQSLEVIGQGDDFLPWFAAQMIMMSAVIYVTVSFMKTVPGFAGYLAGNPKFVNLMKGSGDIGSSAQSGFNLPGEKLKNKIYDSDPGKNSLLSGRTSQGRLAEGTDVQNLLDDSP